MTIKTTEKSIIRIKDLKEQPADTRFILLPGGLDRTIIACNYYEIADKVLTAYIDPDLTPIFSMPVSAGFVIVDRQLTDTETLMDMVKRMYADEKEGELLHDAMTKDDPAHKHSHGPAKVIPLHPTTTDGPPPGQYL